MISYGNICVASNERLAFLAAAGLAKEKTFAVVDVEIEQLDQLLVGLDLFDDQIDTGAVKGALQVLDIGYTAVDLNMFQNTVGWWVCGRS